MIPRRLAHAHIVHVELGRHLYGGARQVAYLLNHLPEASGRHTLICAADAAIATAVDHPAVQVQALTFRGDLDAAFAARLYGVLQTLRPDLLHIHSRRGDWLITLAGLAARVPMVLTRRVDNPEPGWLVRLKYPRYRSVVTISEGIRDVLLAEGVPSRQLTAVLSAVDTERFRPNPDRRTLREELGVPADTLLLGMVAQMIPRKGHATLFEALPKVLIQHPEVRVLVFGKGPLDHELRRWVAERSLEAVVGFAGFRTDMHRILPALDVLVHPAELEGLGVALLEAAASGVPIVAGRAGGIPEVVRDGITGDLVEPRAPDALANALIAMLGDEPRRRAFGLAARAWVEQRFAIPRMVAGNLDVYREVLAAPLTD